MLTSSPACLLFWDLSCTHHNYPWTLWDRIKCPLHYYHVAQQSYAIVDQWHCSTNSVTYRHWKRYHMSPLILLSGSTDRSINLLFSLIINQITESMLGTEKAKHFSNRLLACLSTCLPAYLAACLPAYLPALLPTCLVAYLPCCLPTLLPCSMPACLPACLPAWVSE